MTAYIGFILRWRWLVVSAVLVMTAAAGVMITHGVVASSIGGLFLNEYEDYHRYLKRARDFSSDEIIIVAIEDEDIFSPSSQERIQQAVDEIATLPHILDVRSALQIQRIKSVNNTLDIHTYAEEAHARPENRKILLEQLREDPFARGLFVSYDGKHTVVLIELDVDSERPTEDTPEIIERIVTAFKTTGYSRNDLHIVGPTANIAAVIDETYFSIRRMFPMVIVVLLLAVWMMFHRLWPVAITGIVAFIAVIWTMGFSIMLDRHISVFSSMIPPIIMIISFSDVIHLCSAYLIELNNGKSKTSAIFDSCTEVGAACLLTSITTFVGFVSLSFIPTPATRVLGVSLGVGTAAALLLAVTLTPILFSLLPVPKNWRRGATSRIQQILDRFLFSVSGLTARKPWTIVIIFLFAFVIIAIGLTRFNIETDFSKRMAEDHPLRASVRYFNKNFAGANTLDIYIKTPQPNGLLDPDTIRNIAIYQQALEQLPEIAKVYSLVDLFEILHNAIVPEEEKTDNLPSSRQALAQYLLLFEMSGGTDLDRLVDFDRQVMRLTLHLPKEEYRHTASIGDRAIKMAPGIFGDSVDAEVSGLVYLLGNYFEIILDNQRRALVLAFFFISLIMMAGLRSVRTGIWSMIPNALPLLVLLGYLGLFSDYIDSDVLIVALIAIGIGVDDTIHFLMRLRIESNRHHDTQRAIETTLYYSGRGIVITTVILTVGFSPFALSDYFTINMMGTLLPMTLVVALLADLFLVPALVRIGVIRFAKK